MERLVTIKRNMLNLRPLALRDPGGPFGVGRLRRHIIR
jgi:hypothetical protein